MVYTEQGLAEIQHLDDCKPLYDTSVDLAGAGIIVASGVLCFVSQADIVWAFWRGHLRPNRYSRLDRAFLRWLRSLIRRRHRHDEPVSQGHVEAFERFQLKITEASLVSGLGLSIVLNITLAGWWNFDQSVSVYSFNVAVNLAWLACLTHLSVITSVREHLGTESPEGRRIRMVLMLVTLVLTMVPMIHGQILWGRVGSVACERKYVSVFYSYDSVSLKQAEILNIAVIVLSITWSYTRRLVEIYSETYRDDPHMFHMQLPLLRRATEAEINASKKRVARDKMKLVTELAFAKRGDKTHSIPASLGLWARLLYWVHYELERSFLFELQWLSFYFTWGFGQLAYFILQDVSNPKSQVNLELSMGQILPLLLLLAPAISAYELFSNARERHRAQRQKERENPQEHDYSRAGSLDPTDLLSPIVLTNGETVPLGLWVDEKWVVREFTAEELEDLGHQLDFYGTALRLDRAVVVTVTVFLFGFLFVITQLFSLVFQGWLDEKVPWQNQGSIYVLGFAAIVLSLVCRFLTSLYRMVLMKGELKQLEEARRPSLQQLLAAVESAPAPDEVLAVPLQVDRAYMLPSMA